MVDQYLINRQIYKGEFDVIMRGAWRAKWNNGGKA